MIDKDKTTNIREFIVDETNIDGILEAISLVEEPAIEQDFLYFNKAKLTFKINDEQRIIVGPAMIPDKLIYRNDGLEEFYGFFTKETIKKCAEQFLKEKRNDNMTLQHEGSIQDVYVIESWIVANPEMDKSKALGLTVPEGTWMVSMRVNNEQVWQDIKDGKAKGFSIEGYFGLNKKEKPLLERIKDAIEAGDIELVKNLLK